MTKSTPAPDAVRLVLSNDDAPTNQRLARAISNHPEVMVVERSDPSLELTERSLEDVLDDLAAAPAPATARGGDAQPAPAEQLKASTSAEESARVPGVVKATLTDREKEWLRMTEVATGYAFEATAGFWREKNMDPRTLKCWSWSLGVHYAMPLTPAAAIATQPAPSPGGWQDISTAPPRGQVQIYDPKWGVTEGLRFDDGTWGLATFNGQVMRANPTHWQPLPAAPSIQKGGEG